MRLTVSATLAALLAMQGALAQTAAPSGESVAAPAPLKRPALPNAKTPPRQEAVTLNFVNADLDQVVGAIGQMTNRTFVIDPRVRGTITLATANPVPVDEAYRLLLSTLRLQGFAVVEDGMLSKVVPEADAKLQSGRVQGGAATTRGDQIITQVIRLNFESATNMVPVLRPLISPNNTIAAYPGNNTLVITDYADNVRRIEKIIANVDVPAAVDLEVIPLQHAVAIDMAAMLQRLLDEGRTQTNDPGQRVTVLADPRSNALLMRAGSKARAELAKSLVAKLDQPSARGNNINVVYLKNAEAVKLAQTLRSILTGDTSAPQQTQSQSLAGTQMSTTGTQSGGGLGTQGTGGSQGFGQQQAGAMGNFQNTSTGTGTAGGSGGAQGGIAGMIQADPATNTLIITAPEPIYRNIREIIEKLDARRAQVLVESLIVEVSANLAAEFGIQWQGLSGVNSTDTRVIGGTNFGGTGTNIIGAAQNLGTVGQGLNIGIVKGKINLPGLGDITNLGFLARALENTGQANILSTPNVLTLDNETATFIVGQNVPFVTGQYSSGTNTGTAAVNPFQTIERRDVGLTLKVKPQISEGGVVRLQIYQEQSSISDNTAQGLITNKRSIETAVLVDNGNVVVLGGLIEDSGDNRVQKVPGLGDIPVIGHLFRYENRGRRKTNLMVFLRPYIIRDTATSNSLVADRYDYMRSQGAEAQTPSHWLLPDTRGPQMSPLDSNGTVQPPKPLIDTGPASGSRPNFDPAPPVQGN
ncbi:MAG TPA: type II secretion system secretin GspD [Burkholderiaceae bacterium]|nr:type II secretion system secretin GspD [Burkholderiaceae bacterium]